MINYIEKGYWLHSEIGKQNHSLAKVSGVWVSSDDVAVQAIIDSYDPLPEAKAEAIERVNIKAGEVREKYVTNVPSQDATYQMKLEDANAFKLAGYPENSLASYPFINGEAIATGSSGQSAADLIINTANGWKQLAAGIENERRKANELINQCANFVDCAGIADIAIANLEAM